MDSIIPHLDGWTEIVVWAKNLSALLLGVNPYLRHLFVQCDNHRAQPWRRGIPTIPCHIINCGHSFVNAVDGELFSYYLVISLH